MSLPSTEALTTGKRFSASIDGLDEERHEAELHAVLLLEAVLVARAQLLHRAQIDLVEGREQRLRRLRLHQPFGDARAQSRHRHALLGAAGARQQRAAGASRRWRRGCAGGCRRRGRAPAAAAAASALVMRPPGAEPCDRCRRARLFSSITRRAAGPALEARRWRWTRPARLAAALPLPAALPAALALRRWCAAAAAFVDHASSSPLLTVVPSAP